MMVVVVSLIVAGERVITSSSLLAQRDAEGIRNELPVLTDSPETLHHVVVLDSNSISVTLELGASVPTATRNEEETISALKSIISQRKNVQGTLYLVGKSGNRLATGPQIFIVCNTMTENRRGTEAGTYHVLGIVIECDMRQSSRIQLTPKLEVKDLVFSEKELQKHPFLAFLRALVEAKHEVLHKVSSKKC